MTLLSLSLVASFRQYPDTAPDGLSPRAPQAQAPLRRSQLLAQELALVQRELQQRSAEPGFVTEGVARRTELVRRLRRRLGRLQKQLQASTVEVLLHPASSQNLLESRSANACGGAAGAPLRFGVSQCVRRLLGHLQEQLQALTVDVLQPRACCGHRVRQSCFWTLLLLNLPCRVHRGSSA